MTYVLKDHLGPWWGGLDQFTKHVLEVMYDQNAGWVLGVLTSGSVTAPPTGANTLHEALTEVALGGSAQELYEATRGLGSADWNPPTAVSRRFFAEVMRRVAEAVRDQGTRSELTQSAGQVESAPQHPNDLGAPGEWDKVKDDAHRAVYALAQAVDHRQDDRETKENDAAAKLLVLARWVITGAAA